jgi:hypothetical protein
VKRLGEAVAAVRARPGLAAVVALGVAWGLVIHSMGWAQLGHFAQVRALADGTAEIDRYHWETNDKGYVDGHFYSVKSPGVAGLSLPLYAAIRAAGGEEVARDAATNARGPAHPRWAPPEIVPLENYGYDYDLGRRVEHRIEAGTPMVWPLTLLVAVLPAMLLLLGVRWAADRMEPGYGTAAAVTLGLCTIVMTFAAEYFSHVISAALGFGAFLLLMREREGPPSRGVVALAGLMAGLGVTFEFQVGLVGVILFAYALSRYGDRLRRALAYGAGAVAGALPMLAFNTWAFGNPLKLAYGYAVEEPGLTGHDVLGLNSGGFFGIKAPSLDSAVELLLAGRGLLVLTPIVVMGLVGVVLMRRRGQRAEANVVIAVCAAYFFYNAGYWLPMGGGTPGPRFLIPALPFLALGLAFAYRRFPALTLGLAIPSAVFMLAAALTFPLLGGQGTGMWWQFLSRGELEHTLLTAVGLNNAWLAVTPVLAAVAAAVVLAARATPRTPVHDLVPAFAAVLIWAGISAVGPSIAAVTDENNLPLSGGEDALKLIALGVAIAMATLSALALRGGVGQRDPGSSAPAGDSPAPKAPPAPALGERTT